MREATLPEGETKQIVLGVLAQPTADIQFGHDARDEFVYDSRAYRVVGVRLYDDANCPSAIQADCIAV